MTILRGTRREFVAALVCAAGAWPLVARAQQAIPVIGFLRSTPAEPFAHIVAAFRQGLHETGFIEGQNVAIEQRWADNQLDQLPVLAADLVRHHAAVIVGNGAAVDAARSATATIPIVFVIGGDPVALGLVTSLSRPGGNLTGLTFFGNRLGAKRMETLRELVPGTSVIAALIDPNFPEAAAELREVDEACRAIGQKIVLVDARMNANSMLPSQASPRPARTRSSSSAARSSQANVKRWLRWRRVMPFRPSTTSVTMSPPVA